MSNEMYPSHDETPEQTRKRLAAEVWRYDAELEQALALQRDRPEVFDQLSASTHMAAGFYSRLKRAAKELGIDTSSPRLDTTEGDR